MIPHGAQTISCAEMKVTLSVPCLQLGRKAVLGLTG